MMTSNPLSTDIKPVAIEEEMKRSYLDYAMSVIISRALPDVRDGLKPVHRRILYAMHEANNDYNRPFRKSSRVVGDVLGKYHPHGNTAIYDALVRMAQDFSLRLPLVDGQGNFGSIDGDSPAAERYTEVRMSYAAHDLLEDCDKGTVDYQPNYDELLEEPKVLPAKFPNILVNGANGIAVGMATNIPPHNLGEVLEACCALIDDPMLTVEDLMQFIPAPDFPTGGIIMGRRGILDAYRTGRGSIVMRAKTHFETVRNEREAIIVDEIPYQVNKARMIERMAECVKDKIIEGISDLRDESDRDGIRVVIELKRDAVPDVVLNQLYRYTPLQTSFGANMLAINHGRPEQLNLREFLQAFLEFREEVIMRRTRFELLKARERAHVYAGLAVAVAHIDAVIELIRAAPNRLTARERLMARKWDVATIEPLLKIIEIPGTDWETGYLLTEAQANAILDLRLHRLTGLERDKIAEDLDKLAGEIADYLDILNSRPRVLAIIRHELEQMKIRHVTPRRTEIEEGDSSVDMEDLIQREEMVVTVSMGGYIKRVPLSTYRAQRRGGKGRSGMSTTQEDVVQDVFVAMTHSPVLFFTSTGKVYQLKVYRLPLGSPQSRGRPMINLLPLSAGETISTVLILPEDISELDEMYVMFSTSLGNVRRNHVRDFLNIKSNGKIAMKLDADEKLIAVQACQEEENILLSTDQGKCIRFPVADVRVFVGRASTGVRGIRLASGDRVISMAVLTKTDATTEERLAYLRQASRERQAEGDELLLDSEEEADNNNNPITVSPERYQALQAAEQFILTVTENGFGKRSSSYEYRMTRRGGMGIDGIAVSARNGGVVASYPILEDDQIMLVTDAGKIIRCPVHDIRIAGRRTQGVTIFRIAENEKVVAVSRISGEDSDATDEEVADVEGLHDTDIPTTEDV